MRNPFCILAMMMAAGCGSTVVAPVSSPLPDFQIKVYPEDTIPAWYQPRRFAGVAYEELQRRFEEFRSSRIVQANVWLCHKDRDRVIVLFVCDPMRQYIVVMTPTQRVVEAKPMGAVL